MMSDPGLIPDFAFQVSDCQLWHRRWSPSFEYSKESRIREQMLQSAIVVLHSNADDAWVDDFLL
jgi:hypothetical protein